MDLENNMLPQKEKEGSTQKIPDETNGKKKNKIKKSIMKENELQIDCYTSLGCYLYIVGFCIYILIINLTNNTGISVGNIFAFLVFQVVSIYGLALMIKIRVKHPESKFGKNLMIMYIIADVIAVIMVLLVLGTCVTGCLGLS